MSFDLVLFGGTGDLTWRKLMPALFQAFRHGKLPAGRPHPGGRARRAQRRRVPRLHPASASPRSRPASGPATRSSRASPSCCTTGAWTCRSPSDYAGLKHWLARAERGADTAVLYLATSPHLFPVICEQLGARRPERARRARGARKAARPRPGQRAGDQPRRARGRSARAQALRIDHYLGKPAVQNLMALRFGNALFEPLWRRESIANIQITLAEDLGVGTRGDFYDRTGALRDMVQNHALQLLTMIAMEPPSTNDADAIRDEKLKVLRSLQALHAPRAWRATWCAASTAPARSTASRCRATWTRSRCPPAAAARPSSRCAPRCRTGAGPACPSTCAPASGWPRAMRRSSSTSARCRTRSSRARSSANKLVIKLQPEDGLELHLLAAKGSRQQRALSPVSLDLDFDKAFPSRARRRLRTPAARRDRRPPEPVRAQRRAGTGLALGRADPATPGRNDPTGPRPYAAGSWGPAAASALVARDGCAWAEEQ